MFWKKESQQQEEDSKKWIISINILLHPLTNIEIILSISINISPEDVPWWPYFDRDVADHNMTKIVRMTFLMNFGYALSDIRLI